MRLLFITQAIDERAPVLGFVCGWLRVFASRFSRVSAVCLRKGDFSPPQNVSVYSLGKERGGNRFLYVLRFLQFVWSTRREYDAVFVHMNQEYLLLAGLLWRVRGIPVALWYNHTAGNMWTKIAMRFATVIFHTSPYAFTACLPAGRAGTKKSVRMPAGIDTNRFMRVAEVARSPRSVLYLGRIAPIKGVRTLVEAALLLHARHADFSLTICGDALPRDARYAQEVRALAAPLVAPQKCRFLAGVPNTDASRIFSAHEIFVNLTPRGNYDKTALEAAACGTIPIVSSPAFRDAFPPELFFEERNAASLADTIGRVLSMPEEKKEELRARLREYVVRTHNLSVLVQKVHALFNAHRA